MRPAARARRRASGPERDHVREAGGARARCERLGRHLRHAHGHHVDARRAPVARHERHVRRRQPEQAQHLRARAAAADLAV